MNMRSMAAAAAVAVSIVVGLPATNWAQVTIEASADSATTGKTYYVGPRSPYDPFGAMHADVKRKFAFAGMDSAPPLERKIRAAAAKVRDAKDDTARQSATSELTSQLDKYFEEDMMSRAKELEDVQQRLTNLKAQLERRRAKKQEIIDLQMKVALNEADGLGFYSGPKDQMFNVRVNAPFGVPAEIRIPEPAVAGEVTLAPPLPDSPPVPTASVPAPAPPAPGATTFPSR